MATIKKMVLKLYNKICVLCKTLVGCDLISCFSLQWSKNIYKSAAFMSFQRCSVGLRLEICSGLPSSSTPTLAKHYLQGARLKGMGTLASSCWNRFLSLSSSKNFNSFLWIVFPTLWPGTFWVEMMAYSSLLQSQPNILAKHGHLWAHVCITG